MGIVRREKARGTFAFPISLRTFGFTKLRGDIKRDARHKGQQTRRAFTKILIPQTINNPIETPSPTRAFSGTLPFSNKIQTTRPKIVIRESLTSKKQRAAKKNRPRETTFRRGELRIPKSATAGFHLQVRIVNVVKILLENDLLSSNNDSTAIKENFLNRYLSLLDDFKPVRASPIQLRKRFRKKLPVLPNHFTVEKHLSATVIRTLNID